MGFRIYISENGKSVHTTEYNLTSSVKTQETGGAVLWRRSDIENQEIGGVPSRIHMFMLSQ